MTCPVNVGTDAKLEAVNAYWGRQEKRNIKLVADVAGSLSTYYFDLHAINADYSETKYYLWLDNGSSTDPAVSGKTGIQVTYSDGDSVATIITLIKAAVETHEFLMVDNGDDSININNVFLGVISTETENAAGFTFNTCTSGIGGFLGEVAQGGWSVETAQSATDIMGDSSGDVVLDQIIKGTTVSATVALIELTQARRELLIGSVEGDILTVGQDKIVGYGTGRVYSSKAALGGRLVLHPIRLENTDRSLDFCIYNCVPSLGSVNYSGTDIQQADATFNAYKASGIDTKINLAGFGDHSLV